MNLNCPEFQPHSIRPTRCKRCFKDYKEHNLNSNASNLINNCEKNYLHQSNGTSSNSSQSIQNKEEKDAKSNLKARVQIDCQSSSSSYTKKNEDDDDQNKADSLNNEVYTSFMVNVNPNCRDTKSPNRIKIISAQEESKRDQDDTKFILKVKLGQESEDLIAINKPQINSIDSILNKINSKLDDIQKCSCNNLNLNIISDQLNHSKTDLNISKTSLEEINDKLKHLQSSYNEGVDDLADDKAIQLQIKFLENQKTLNNCKKKIILLEKEINFNQDNNNQLIEKISKLEDYHFKLNQLLINKTTSMIKSPIKLDLSTQVDLVVFNKLLIQLETHFKELDDQIERLNNQVKNDVIKLNKKNDKVTVSQVSQTLQIDQDLNKLNDQLVKSEKLCTQLAQENEEYLKKIKLLEQELEELHDSFREDQVCEYRDIKKELEIASKNIRVLQFKLRKSEKYCLEIENEKLNLENKIKELLETSLVSYDKQKMKDIQKELAIAKEVSLKLYTEIESMKEANSKIESSSESPNQAMNSYQSQSSHLKSFSNDAKDYQELVRSLYDTMEREKDLQEQLRFSEEESRVMRKKLSSIEQENEILMMQIKKMANQKGKSNKILNGGEESDEMTTDEIKFHLELYEQEITVLRKKTDELEVENDSLQQEIKYLQEKLISQPLTKTEIPEILNKSSPNVIYEHKIRLLEIEVQNLRKKLIEKEKINENLRTELDLYLRKAPKFSNRSRSLKNEGTIELKCKLQLMDQETSVLRQKVINLEKENEKLLNENKKMKNKNERRSSLDSFDASKFSLQSNLIKDSLKNCENDLITSLKQQLSNKEEDELHLKRKITELEIEISKISLDYKKLKDSFSLKKKSARIVKESATRLELKEIIKELEEEINLIYSNLTTSKVINENLEREMIHIKQQLELVQIDLRNKETKLSSQLESYQKDIESLEKKLSYHQNQSLSSTNIINQLVASQDKNQQLIKEIQEIKQEQKQTLNKLNDLTQEFNLNIEVKKDLEAKNEINQKDKEKLSSDLIKMTERAASFEEQFKETKKSFELKNIQIENIQKECQQLKNQLKEKMSILQQDSSSNSVKITKDDYKKMKDLQNERDSLNSEIENLIKNEKIIEEKLKETNRKLEKSFEEKLKIENENGLLQVEIKSIQSRLSQTNKELDQVKYDLKESRDKYRLQSLSMRKEKDDWEIKLRDQETQIRIEQRKREKFEKESDFALKEKDKAMIQLKEKIFFLERELKRIKMTQDQEKVEYEMKLKSLERESNKAKNELLSINQSYSNLENELVKIKANQKLEKEKFFQELTLLNQKYDEKVKELKNFKNLFGDKQEEWLQEKLDFEQDLREMERNLRILKNCSQALNQPQSLQIDDKTLERDKKFLEKIKNLKNENKKLKEMINSINLSQSKKVKIGLNDSEILFQTELTNLKTNYEEKLKLLCNEIDCLIEERDQLELKIRIDKKLESSEISKEKMEENNLEMENLKEKLEAALNDNKKLKIEYDCEKSSWLVKSAQLESQINQMNEQNLMETSNLNQDYYKSKIEVAWQKERQNLQKLLSETQKLVEELKAKLLKLEVFKNKKKDEETKKIKKLKKSIKQKKEDDKKKIGELNLDLIYLRGSFSKIRAQNESLKKEILNLEKDKEDWKIRLFAAINVENKLTDLWQDLKKLDKLMVDFEKKSTLSKNNIELGELRKFFDDIKLKVDQMLKISKFKEATSYRKTFSFRTAISSFDMSSKPFSLETFARMPPIGFKRTSTPKSSLQTKFKKWLSLDQNIMTSCSKEHILDSEDDTSLRLTPTTLKSFQGLNHRHSAISGYDSEGSNGNDYWKISREGSIGERSDTSAPVTLSKSKRSLFNLIKKARSVDNTYSHFEKEKEGDKVNKEKELKSKLSKTIKKNLSLSSSLEVRSKEEIKKENQILKRTSNVRPLNVYLDSQSSSAPTLDKLGHSMKEINETGKKDTNSRHKNEQNDISGRSRSTRV